MEHSLQSKPGLLLIISGPSGVGKTTITHAVEKELNAAFSISMTTRPQAAGDTDGADYFFVDEERFRQARDADELLEWAQVFGNYYGTPRGPVEEALAEGRIVLLEIDVDGASQVKRAMPDAYALFVLPPNEGVLLERLHHRRREDEATIQRRFGRAKEEITLARTSGVYDLFIVNDDLEVAVKEAVEAVRKEQTRRQAE